MAAVKGSFLFPLVNAGSSSFLLLIALLSKARTADASFGYSSTGSDITLCASGPNPGSQARVGRSEDTE